MPTCNEGYATGPVAPTASAKLVPPATPPLLGVKGLMPGTGATYVNRSAATTGDVPEGVVTVMSTAPPAWAGAVAVICVAESTVKLLAATAPNLTAVT